MGKYLYRDLAPGVSAVVSTHGHFEIQKRESFNGYQSGIGPVYKTAEDGTKERCPDPVVVYRGPVSDLGLTYENDDLADPELDTEDDGYEFIRGRLLEYLAARDGSGGDRG